MPRSRGSEMPQRQSSQGSYPRRSSSSSFDSDPVHHRRISDRNSSKVGARRSPVDSFGQKKLGTRIADLESQLGQAQDELKCLKEQLASAEAEKKEAQQQLEKKKKKSVVQKSDVVVEKYPQIVERESRKGKGNNSDKVFAKETDVFEVPMEKRTVFPEVEQDNLIDGTEKENNNPICVPDEPPPVVLKPEKPSLQELLLKDEEINMLKSCLVEKEKELDMVGKENEKLKNQVNEVTSNLLSSKANGDELSSRLKHLGVELEASKANAAHLNEKLEVAEGAKEALEAEMKKMRVQTEQWRKAADAAAAILAGGVKENESIPERCGSMDKHFNSMFETPVGGYTSFVGSPGMSDDLDDGFGSVKRKGSGIRMFGDLWRKKGHQK